MKPVKRCARCDRVLEVVHRSLADCFADVDRDINAAVAHLRTLTKRKSKLLRTRIDHRRQVVITANRRTRQ
jgi:hypothetical protein